MINIIEKYLQVEATEPCAHCHKSAPVKGKTVCAKCSKELEAFRNKASKDNDEGNEG